MNFKSKILISAILVFLLNIGSIYAQKKDITYYAENNYPPYSYSSNNNPTGFDADLTTLVFNGYDYGVKEYTGNWDDVYSSIKAGMADTCGLIEINDTRKSDVLFSNPVLKTYIGIFTRKNYKKVNLNTLSNFSIGVVRSHNSESILKNKLGIKTYKTYPDIESATRALVSNQIEVLFEDENAVNYALILENAKGLITLQQGKLFPEDLAYAVSKDSPGLVTYINKRIKDLKGSGVYEELYQKYFLSHSEDYYASTRNILIIIGVLVLVSLISLRYIIRFLRRKILKINKELFREHEWLQTTLSSIDDSVITADNEGRIIYANLTAQMYLNLDDTLLIGKKINEVLKLYSEETHSLVEIPMESLLKGEEINFKKKMLKLSDGNDTEYVVSISVLPIKNNRQIKGTVIVFHDITAQVNAEILLKKERDFSDSIVREANIIIIVGDKNGEIIRMNKFAENLTGYSTEEIKGKSWLDFLIPENIYESTKKAYEKIVMSELNKAHETQIMCKNGKILTVLWNNNIIYDSDGNVEVILTTGNDITERKEAEMKLQNSYDELEATHEELAAAEEELKQQYIQLQASQEALTASEERYRLAFEGANDGLWDWNVITDEMYFSSRWKEILGYEDWEIKNKSSAWFDLLHPDEYDPVMKTVDDYLEAVIPNFRIEYRIRSKSGEYKWFLTRGQAIRDKSGKPIRIAGSHTDITDRKKAEEKIQVMAFYDSLTGLPNRTLFSDRLNVSLNQARRYGYKGALLFLDLDNFKTINDTLGHASGDILLKYIGELIKSCIRESDTIARLSGDEFVILQQKITSVDEAKLISQRIVQQLQQPVVLDGCEFYITASIGITVYPDDGDDQQTLLKNADTAMYHAKELGKNNYQVFSESLNVRYQERYEMEGSLRHAIVRDELDIHYQPQVDINTGKIVSLEALLRWNHPKLGMIPPAKFIPIAEETGLIIPIGEWVLRKACKKVKDWQDQGYGRVNISVNLSVKQFYQCDIVSTIKDVLKETDLEPKFLELEITESIAIQDLESVVRSLNTLKAMGIKVSLDDFGTGYSSLNYLKRIPIDMLKIDKAFINDIGKDNNQEAITKAVIAIAHVMDISVIAEGVETREQFEFLSNNDCDIVQGYLLSKPLPEKEVENLVKLGTIYM
ncbi:MAG: EAL domain-containing protein [Bacillota bacterium]|nr:EAL domain-containing protein [Bacillota bacterium]